MSKMRKPKTLRAPMPIVANTSSSGREEMDRQFELELCWCVQQLETALNSGKLSQKVADDTHKNLKILKGHNPIIKKRQVMKSSLGDYRAKMKEEEKKMSLAPKQIKFRTSSAGDGKKSSFVKKSAISSSGKDFKFNFKMTPDNDLNEKAQMNSTITRKFESSVNPEKINLNSDGSQFAFNFVIDDIHDDISFDALSIKN
ncbi:UPF0488 protein CG14286 [Stomoxys calcitrans]|uniref:Uncharacterized protein n=1 Tax=Stomoxys calcitrans TaxID=35570 RepID=A0A1I8PBU3_STOCA|nr:UPF0488 protein CG14286 [Stomoxys calcitrans]XP_013116990.1 UPF0488 protein CG14286 [Stomoxys calcitrans]